jgi:hypothetical protein
MIKLTKFEADLVRLNWIESRFHYMFKEYQKAMPKKNFDFSFASILREYAMIQLLNFIEARKNMKKRIKEKRFHSIDKVLEPMWKPIFDHEDGIREIRNSYLGHIQNWGKSFEITIDELSEQYQFPNTKGDMLFLMSCAMQYSEFIRRCYPTESINATKKVKLLKPVNTVRGILTNSRAITKAVDTYKQSEKELKRLKLIQ